MMKAALTFFSLLAFILAPLPVVQAAPAIKAEAKSHLTKGGELYKQGKYDEAIAEFLTGYSIDPSPLFLYALGQAERKKGDCNRANDYYRSFLQTSPTHAQAKAAQSQIQRCEDQASAEKAKAAEETKGPELPPIPPPVLQPQPPVAAVTPETPHEVTTPPIAPLANTSAIDRKPWYKDVWGGLLLGGGVAAIGVGAWLFTSAGSDEENAARTAPDYLSYSRQLSDAEGKRNLSIILLSAGGALTAGAILRYVFSNRSDQAPAVAQREIRIAPTLTGIRVWGRF